MKYYDTKTKKYYTEQNSENTRIPFLDGALNDAFDRAANGESVNVEDLQLPSFFDKNLIAQFLLYAELKYLARTKTNSARAEEIKAILYPPEEEEELNVEEENN